MSTAPPRSRTAGMTIIEVVTAAALLAILAGGITTAYVTLQSAIDEEMNEADLQFRSRNAVDRLVRLISTAVTTDTEYGLLDASDGGDPRGLRFRDLLQVKGGEAVYDDLLVVHIIGPDAQDAPCTGIVVGRGPTLDEIHKIGCGTDGFLGTEDDDTQAVFEAGTPAVELILPSEFAPRTGSMLRIAAEAGSQGRLLTVTLRCNFQGRDGNWVRQDDLVVTEKVSLRW